MTGSVANIQIPTKYRQIVFDRLLLLFVFLSGLVWCLAPHIILMMMKLCFIITPYIVTVLVVYAGRRGVSRSYRLSTWLRWSFVAFCASSTVCAVLLSMSYSNDLVRSAELIIPLFVGVANCVALSFMLVTGIGIILDKNSTFIIDPPTLRGQPTVIQKTIRSYDAAINKSAAWSFGPKLTLKVLLRLLGQTLLIIAVAIFLLTIYQGVVGKIA